nr:NAD(P)/FAD-dependent oxidoreductase [Flavobacterium jejuense]
MPLINFTEYINMGENKSFEVIIVGGSYAGLSAAMALGRSLRSVLIIDSGKPCNQQTPHSHNFITQDGVKPSEIAKKAKEQVLEYNTVKFLNDLAISGKKTENGFIITTESGGEFKAKKLIFATGIKDTMPNIKGFAACWGISIVHCPYCHGYELRNKKTGIVANGDRAFHLASLVNNLTNNITILTTGKADFNKEQLTKFDNHNIKIIETEISEIEHENGQVKNVLFNNSNKINFEGIYAALPFTQHSHIPVSLGCELNEHGFIKTNGYQKTTIEGVYVCGDNSSMMRSVATAVYTGNLTGAMINKELTDEQF